MRNAVQRFKKKNRARKVNIFNKNLTKKISKTPQKDIKIIKKIYKKIGGEVINITRIDKTTT